MPEGDLTTASARNKTNARPAPRLRAPALPGPRSGRSPIQTPANSSRLRVPMLGRLDRLPRFFKATRGKQAPRDLRGDLRHFPGLLLVLSNESIDVALHIRNLGQRQTYSADPGALGHLIRVDRSRRRPGDFNAVAHGGLGYRTVRQIDHPLLQVLEAGLPQCRREDRDQLVELAVAVLHQSLVGAISETR